MLLLALAIGVCILPLGLGPAVLTNCVGSEKGCDWRGAAYFGVIGVPGAVATALAFAAGWLAAPRTWPRRIATVLLIALAAVDLAVIASALS